jgi:hypothetical protein
LVKPLGKKESEELFGKYTKRYKALELVVENNNDCYFILHPWYIGLPLVEPKKVARDMHTNTLLVVWSMIGAGFFGIEWLAPLSPLLYASIPVGMWLSARNKNITKMLFGIRCIKAWKASLSRPSGKSGVTFSYPVTTLCPTSL